MSEFLQSFLDPINSIADAWLKSGVSSFSFWDKGTLVRTWGKAKPDDEDIITSTIKKNGFIYGELRVSGKDLKPAQGRLAADAKVLAVLLDLLNNQQQLCEDLIDTRDQLVILSSISEVTRTVINIEELLRSLAAEAIKLVKCEEAFFLIEIDHQEPIAVFHPRQTIQREYLAQISQQIQSKEQPLIISTAIDGSGDGLARNILLIPIKLNNASLAIMGLISKSDKEVSSYEIKLAKAITDYAAAQIEKINLMRANIEMTRIETEVELAQKIQQSLLLKTVPQVPGLDVCMAFQPASRVSGDYYDIIVKQDQTVDFIIGDISGKGMPAALLMAMTLKVIRSIAVTSAAPTPDIIIGSSNETLYKDYNDSVMFSTLFAGQYNPATREVLYSNAGHSPVIYYRAGKKAEMLLADSVPLGLFLDMNCQLGKITLAPGDILVLATDGINETSNKSSRLFGFTQLMMLVEMLAQKPAAEITNGILQAVTAYGAGKSQEDDRAMFVIKGV